MVTRHISVTLILVVSFIVITKFIAQAVDCQDINGLLRIVFDLFAQIAHVGIDSAFITSVALAQSSIEQLQTAVGTADILAKGGEDRIFGRGQVDDFAADSDFAAIQIDLQLAEGKLFFGRSLCGIDLGPAQDSLDAGLELAEAEGIGDIIICSQLQSQQLIDLFIASRDHDDRHCRMPSEPLADLQAVHLG